MLWGTNLYLAIDELGEPGRCHKMADCDESEAALHRPGLSTGFDQPNHSMAMDNL